MLRKWRTISVAACLSAVLLLGLATAPHAAELNNGSATAQATVESTNGTPATASAKTTSSSTSTANKKQKSVLDAESLESPFSFFKDMSTSDEDESEMNVRPSAAVLAIKALIATLLSTIM